MAIQKRSISQKRRKGFPSLKIYSIRPSSPEIAKQYLEDVAEHLSGWPNAPRSFRFVASAIKRFLRAAEKHDLENKLGLIYPAGRPKRFAEPTRERNRARTIVRLRDEQNLSWHSIGEQVDLRDKRSVKRIYDKYKKEFAKELLQQKIDSRLRALLREE